MKDKNILKFQTFYFLLIGGVGAFTPYINVYLEHERHLTGSQIGLITFLSLIIGVCVIPLWGIIGDKTRKYNMLLCVSLAATIVTLFIYKQQTVYLGVILCALILEIVRLGSTPMADTITMSYTTPHQGNYGAIRGMGSMGYMLASMFVGFLADRYGYNGPMFTTYMVLLGLALLLGFSFPKHYDKKLQEAKVEKGNFRELITDKNFLFILIITMLTTNVVDSSGQYAGNHLVTTLHASNALISWQTFIQVLPEILFLAVAVKFLKKMGYKRFYLMATILMAVRLGIYAFVPNAYIFVAAGIVHCLGVACQTVGNLSYLKASINNAVYGTAITLMSAAMSIAKAIYGYVFGSIYQYFGSYTIFTVSLILVLIAIVILFRTQHFAHLDAIEE